MSDLNNAANIAYVQHLEREVEAFSIIFRHMDESGDPVGAQPESQWEKGYAAGLRFAYRVLKERRIPLPACSVNPDRLGNAGAPGPAVAAPLEAFNACMYREKCGDAKLLLQEAHQFLNAQAYTQDELEDFSKRLNAYFGIPDDY